MKRDTTRRHESIPYNKDFIHHRPSAFIDHIKQIVFGTQDGMVSTLGAVTGIAIGSDDTFTVVLAGLAIITVESISMAIGSFTSSLTEHDVANRMVAEERIEIEAYPRREVEELVALYERDGWPRSLALEMANHASSDGELMLKEMKYRELELSSRSGSSAVADGAVMFVSYMIGGSIPLVAYFFMPIQDAIRISIPLTLSGLFILGVLTTFVTKVHWLRAGLRLLVLGSLALLAGYVVGDSAELLRSIL